MQVFIHSLMVVALAEMGDKTQLLALILASRYRSRTAVLTGILGATLLNHALAACAGAQIASYISADQLRIWSALLFIAFGIWVLFPDRAPDPSSSKITGAARTTWGKAALLSAVSFFIAEFGDKTQLATAGLGAHYSDRTAVVAGTTVGMLLADGLAIALGDALGAKVPLQKLRWVTCGIFFATAAAIFLSTSSALPH